MSSSTSSTGSPASPRAKVRAIPPLVLRAMALVNPTVRELLEMQYQFDEPFIVDSTDITTLLGAVATPMERGLEQTVDSYRRATAA